MPAIAEARPPYFEFEGRMVEQFNPAPPLGDGMLNPIMKDFVVITPQGSKDRIEKLVDDWFSSLDMRVKMDMYPKAWLESHRAAYKHWKETNELPLEGTPIKGWPLATLAEQKKLIDLNLRTVEDLAVANAESIGRLGMGGLSLKSRAENFLAAKQDTGPLVSRVESMTSTLAEMEKRLTTLAEENRLLRAEKGIKEPEPVPMNLEARLAEAQAAAGADPVDAMLTE